MKPLLLLTLLVVLTNASCAQLVSATGTLSVQITGMNGHAGQLVVRVFRAQDDIFGKPYRELRVPVEKPTEVVELCELPFDTYSALVFQDVNNNGVLDHNWVHFPNEPLGWSNNWHPGLRAGMPTFEKTKFLFQQSGSLSIVLQ